MTIFYMALCIAHVTLVALHVVPPAVAVCIAVGATVMTYKRIQLTWSSVALVILLPLHLLTNVYGSVLILAASAVLVIYSTKAQQTMQHAAATNAHVQAQLTHFNETFQHVRRQRHDYLKHVAAISYMLERDDVDAAKAYMHTLIEQYEETNLSIKGEQGAVASVLHANYKRAIAENIAMHYDLDVPVSSLPVAPEALVQLLGNILENAVDAAVQFQQASNEQAVVTLTLQKKSGLYVLTCTNSTVPLPNAIADVLFEETVTTKDGHSGLGTSIIAHIVAQHGGFLDFTTEKETFILTCKLPHVI